jgi:hypothetical protein
MTIEKVDPGSVERQGAGCFTLKFRVNLVKDFQFKKFHIRNLKRFFANKNRGTCRLRVPLDPSAPDNFMQQNFQNIYFLMCGQS